VIGAPTFCVMGALFVSVTDTLENESLRPITSVVFPSWFLSILKRLPVTATALFKYKLLANFSSAWYFATNESDVIAIAVSDCTCRWFWLE